MLARTAASLVGFGLLLSAGTAFAQERGAESYSSPAGFSVSPNVTLPPQAETPSFPSTPTPPQSTWPVQSTTPAQNWGSPVPSSRVQYPSTVGGSTLNLAPPRAGQQTQVYEKAPYAPVQTIRQVAYQPARSGPRPGAEDAIGWQLRTEPPGPSRLFQLESEKNWQQRVIEESKDRQDGIASERVTFPDEPVVSTEHYSGRAWPLFKRCVEPNYVCYDRLYFEEKNSERFGWDLGIAQPFLSTGYFFAQVLTLPYNWATDPCRCYECSAGYCLPGDPVPYRIDPPGLSATGGLAEAAAIMSLIVIFP